MQLRKPQPRRRRLLHRSSQKLGKHDASRREAHLFSELLQSARQTALHRGPRQIESTRYLAQLHVLVVAHQHRVPLLGVKLLSQNMGQARPLILGSHRRGRVGHDCPVARHISALGSDLLQRTIFGRRRLFTGSLTFEVPQTQIACRGVQIPHEGTRTHRGDVLPSDEVQFLQKIVRRLASHLAHQGKVLHLGRARIQLVKGASFACPEPGAPVVPRRYTRRCCLPRRPTP